MTSNKDQDARKQPNYAEHLNRVRQVRRTLDSISVENFSSQNPPGSEREHVSHESTKDQAISRKTRRPGGDYEVGKGLFPADGHVETNASDAEISAAKPGGAGVPPAPSHERSEPGGAGVPPAPSHERSEPGGAGVPPAPSHERSEPGGAGVPPASTAAKPPEQTPPAKPGERKVAETQLEVSAKTPPAKPPERTVAPTQLEVSANAPLDSLHKSKIVKNVAGAPSNKKPKASQQFVAKTLIDHNEILRAQALRQKERVEQVVSSRQQVQVKLIEPIKAQKEIRSCPFSWNDDSAKEGFKHCSKCQHTIYNFDGIEFSDAEKLIFKRENLKKFVLYKRPDGKFMTSECPVARKRKQQLIGLVAICICLIACLGGVLMLMPPAPPPTAANSWSETAPDAVSTESPSPDAKSNSSATKTSGTTQHYEAGDSLPTEPTNSGANTTNSQNQKNFSESEEKGDFWEFQ